MNVWYYGNDINTDMLFPGKYTYTCSTPEEIKPHLLEDLDASFSKNVKQGDIIFAGKNFGCGSSREQPVVGLKAVGIKAVIAKSFARIFYRSAINQGLLLIESSKAVEAYSKGDSVTVDADHGLISVGDKQFHFPQLPPEIIAIQKAGGLLPYVREILKK
jgi:3-isopropylmalate/(R)-2-methylmalate dehydratase small subunit